MTTTARSVPGRPRVVIVGAGFAGLAAAKTLGKAPVEVTIVDRHNHHVFTPFLYQVATALLEPSAVAQPVREVVRRLKNVTFRLGQVTDVHLAAKQIETDRGPISYDYLVLAAGSVTNYFGNSDIATTSLGLNDLAEALQLRNRILSCFEQAAWATDPDERAHLLSYAVVGGGPTGVEFAAALAVLVAGLVERDFPTLQRDEITVTLVEGDDAPLGSFARPLQHSAIRALTAKGVQVRSNAKVVDVDEGGLVLDGGQRIDAATVVWAAGVRAVPLAESLGVVLATHGRVPVSPTLQLPDHPEVFAVGDLAEICNGKDALPMLAQVAIQSGCHAGRQVTALLSGAKLSPFRYRDLGTMATVGRNSAVAQIGPLRLTGLVGWLAWLLVHIVRTAGLESRASTLISWTSGYLFADRPIRFITGPRQDAAQTEPDAPVPTSPTHKSR